jgi:hypothetical protein
MAWQTSEDVQPAAGVVVPIRIAPWIYCEFLDVAVPMANPNAVAMLAIVQDGYSGDLTAHFVYRYKTEDTESEDCA